MKPRLPTIRDVWVIITIGAAFIGPVSAPIGLPDIFWTLRLGELIARQGSLLPADPLTRAPHVAGALVNVQWFADLFFHGLESVGGLALVIVGTAVAVTITFALLVLAAYTATGRIRLSCLSAWIAFVVGSSNLSPRPQTLAYPLFMVFVLAVVRAEWRKDTRLLWLLPPITVLWANVHGSFFLGLVLLACAGLGRAIDARSVHAARAYAVTFAACVLAALLNPSGAGILVYLASIGSNSVIRDLVTEWAPTTIDSQTGFTFFLSLLVFGAGALKARIRLTTSEILTLLVFGLQAWSSVRAVVWWGLVMAPTLARLYGALLPTVRPRGRDRPLVNLAIALGVVGLAALSLPWTKSVLPFLPVDKRGVLDSHMPIGVGEYLRTHPLPGQGLMFNYETWGGYLDWTAWPANPPFVDGRVELYPPQVWSDYLEIVFPSTQWRALLDRYDISSMVLSTSLQADLVADLRADPAWRLEYDDGQAVVFTRSG